jgi:hypothetical protein
MDKPRKNDASSTPPDERDGLSRDPQGNTVWKWAKDSGRQLIESTSILLKRLEVPGLKLEDDVSLQTKTPAIKPTNAPKPAKPAKPAESAANTGYDPYGHRRAAPQAVAKKPAPAPEPSPPRSWWQRLFRRD